MERKISVIMIAVIVENLVAIKSIKCGSNFKHSEKKAIGHWCSHIKTEICIQINVKIFEWKILFLSNSFLDYK